MSGEIRGSGVGLPVTNEGIAQTSVSLLDQDGYEIGFLQSFNPTFSRPVSVQRAIGASFAGRAVEMTPGVETYTATASGIVLYSRDRTHHQSLINRVGGNAAVAWKVLADQTEPFYLYMTAQHPAANAIVGSDPAASGFLFGGGWFTSENFQVNIAGGNNVITGTINMTFAWVEPIEEMPT